jgi:cytolysin (calcineurin-like family phosphatase)
VDTYFAQNMFNGCSGAAFQVNGAFKFPALAQTQLNKTSVFDQTFANLGSGKTQTRTAASIINNTLTPNSDRNTFAGSAFSDITSISSYWR